MAKYTIELRWLIENGYALPLQSYPIWNESYRSQLNQKIVQHFYFREIGFEVPGLFANRLSEKMDLIMPYYNKLYSALAANYDPLLNQDWTDTTTRALKRDKDTGRTSSGTTQDRQTSHQTASSHESASDGSQGSGIEDRKEQSSGTGEASGSSTSKSIASTEGTQTDSGSDTTSSTNTRTGKQVRSDTPQGLLQASSVNDNTWASDAQLQSGSDTGKSTLIHEITSDQDSTTTTDVDGSTKQTTQNSTTGTSSTTRSDQRTDTHSGDQSSTSAATTEANATSSVEEQGKEQEQVGEQLQRTVQGRQGTTWSALFTEYREALVSVDMLIMEELEELFMQIW